MVHFLKTYTISITVIILIEILTVPSTVNPENTKLRSSPFEHGSLTPSTFNSISCGAMKTTTKLK